MSRFLLSSYLIKHMPAIPHLTSDTARFYDAEIGDAPTKDTSYAIGWGRKMKGRGLAMETGFAFAACHLDQNGLYDDSSLNFAEAQAEIAAFKAPRSAEQVLLAHNLPASKYTQPSTDLVWDGIVLACQNPTDRSVLKVGTSEDYWNFYTEACRVYRKHLLIKLHPWNRGTAHEKRATEIASGHGCPVGYYGHSVIRQAKFVLVYNSTFSVDCMIRGVQVVQFAPGYFHRTGGVFYTTRQLPDQSIDTVEMGRRLADFLFYRYMTSTHLPGDLWFDLFKAYRDSTSLFPMPPELAYGNACVWYGKKASPTSVVIHGKRTAVRIPPGYRIRP